MEAAVFYGGEDIRTERLPVPVPGPGEVLVRVRAAGICGSDLLAYRGLGPWQHRATQPAGDGHELAGEIAALGAGVVGLEVGQRVGIEPKHLIACGSCPACRAGRSQLCPDRGRVRGVPSASHGFSMYDTCPADRVHPIPHGVSMDAAAILDCYACAVHAMNLVRPRSAGTAVVLGCGTIGLTMGQVARAHGLRVVLTGTHESALDIALRAGAADEVVHVGHGDGIEKARALTGSVGADVVFEAVGKADLTLDQAIQIAAPGCPVCILSVFDRSPFIEPHRAYTREASIMWSNSYSTYDGRSEYGIALGLLADGSVRADPLITHHFPLAAIGEAFATAADKGRSGSIKVIIQP
jgi:threonine dehydrogenase-like Zn-dependent dehydrogenase